MKSTILAVVASLSLTSAAVAGGLTETVDAPVVSIKEAQPVAVVSGSVGLDFTQNANDDIVGDSVVELGVTSGLGFASVELVEDNGGVSLEKYSMGTTIRGIDVSIGKQGDVLGSFGGMTEKVGGTTLANPADDHESLQIGAAGVLASIGFTDIASDVTDVENVQLAYGTVFNSLTVISGVDYNFNTEDLTLLTNVSTGVAGLPVGVTATYGDTFAYEADVTAFGVTGFVNGDEGDMLQNVGAGYYGDIADTGLSYYAEGAYNLDAEEITPAAGISFSF